MPEATTVDRLCSAILTHQSRRVAERFEIIRCVGRGGMGVVYEAHDLALNRRVALKAVRTASERASEQLVHEGIALAQLDHPNVLRLFDVLREGCRVYLVLELVAGVTLRHALAAGNASLAHYLEAGRALAAAHRVGVVHRDFKPENALVGEDGRLRVIDFGLARLDADAPLDSRSEVALTPEYAAPEQWSGRGVGPAADQYAFCVALHEALTGVRPRDAAVDVAAMRRAGVPLAMRRALVIGLSRDPARRHRDMDALLVALQPPRRRALMGSIAAVAIAGLVSAATGDGAVPRSLGRAAQESSPPQRVADADARDQVREAHDDALRRARAGLVEAKPLDLREVESIRGWAEANGDPWLFGEATDLLARADAANGTVDEPLLAAAFDAFLLAGDDGRACAAAATLAHARVMAQDTEHARWWLRQGDARCARGFARLPAVELLQVAALLRFGDGDIFGARVGMGVAELAASVDPPLDPLYRATLAANLAVVVHDESARDAVLHMRRAIAVLEDGHAFGHIPGFERSLARELSNAGEDAEALATFARAREKAVALGAQDMVAAIDADVIVARQPS